MNLKLGRKEPTTKPSLLFKDIWKATPSHPVAMDYLDDIGNWKMLGNDKYGDCVAVAWANSRKFVSSLLGGKEVYPTLDDVLKLYKTQNPNFPNEDNGMVVQEMLDYIRKNGDPLGNKPIAFAEVDTSDLEEVKAALYIFGSLILGMDVTYANMDDFDTGGVWKYYRTSPIAGGHAVLAGGYFGETARDIEFVTWAEETCMTDACWNHQVNNYSGEAWVVIWPENLGTKQFVNGIDIKTLAENFKDLTGEDLPIPTPPPTPEPTPVSVTHTLEILSNGSFREVK
jgi:hypothetical protein